MFLTEEGIRFLAWNALWITSLLICAVVLLVPGFRRRPNNLKWLIYLNLAGGLFHYGQYPVAALQELVFKTIGAGYARQEQPFEGRGLHIPRPDLLAAAAYGCHPLVAENDCPLPIHLMIGSGALDFVEIGQDPVIRHELVLGDMRCFDESNLDLGDFVISAGLGACVLPRTTEGASASHVVEVTERHLAWPSRMPYWRAELIERDSGQVLSRFDGWLGMDGFWFATDPDRPRRPMGALARLMARQDGLQGYDRARDDALLAKAGWDEAVLLGALDLPYQGARAETVFLACRDQIRIRLSPVATERLRAASEGLFPDAPDWRFPEDCPDWAR